MHRRKRTKSSRINRRKFLGQSIAAMAGMTLSQHMVLGSVPDTYIEVTDCDDVLTGKYILCSIATQHSGEVFKAGDDCYKVPSSGVSVTDIDPADVLTPAEWPSNGCSACDEGPAPSSCPYYPDSTGIPLRLAVTVTGLTSATPYTPLTRAEYIQAFIDAGHSDPSQGSASDWQDDWDLQLNQLSITDPNYPVSERRCNWGGGSGGVENTGSTSNLPTRFVWNNFVSVASHTFRIFLENGKWKANTDLSRSSSLEVLLGWVKTTGNSPVGTYVPDTSSSGYATSNAKLIVTQVL